MASVSNPERRLASQEDLHRIAEIVEDNYESLGTHIKLDESSVVTRYFNGHHRTVFELKEFPNYIIKLGQTDETMLKTIQSCAAVVERLGLHRCAVPDVHLITRPNGEQFWVEEKLDGIFSSVDAKATSEREFTLLDINPALRQKWNEIFMQAALFIIETGYWDVDWRNVLLMLDGVGFIDFEKMAPGDRELITSGLIRLLEMAPPGSIDSMLEVIAEKGYLEDLKKALRKPIEDFKREREQSLELHARVRKFHETKTYSTLTDRVDASKYPTDSDEHKIIQTFNRHMNYKGIACNIGTDLLNIRNLRTAPYRNVGDHLIWNLSSEELKAKVDELVPPIQEKYEAALMRLKEDGVIAEWVTNLPQYDHQDSRCIGYDVFF